MWKFYLSSRKGAKLKLDYEKNRVFEWPVEMQIATREEIAVATADQIEMYNYQADRKFELMQQIGINM
ncbi:hypothetical protein [Lactiplantibacillus plantarum]|uniref:hypothetical protein n=1 Tax=Lactiplantibacillus plantarum TaxID=1590 RepID=UPI003F52BC8B